MHIQDEIEIFSDYVELMEQKHLRDNMAEKKVLKKHLNDFKLVF